MTKICYGIKYPLNFEFIWNSDNSKWLDFNEWWEEIFGNMFQSFIPVVYGDEEIGANGYIIAFQESIRIIDIFDPYILTSQLLLSKYDDQLLIDFCKKYAYSKEEVDENPDFFIPRWYIAINENE